MQLEIKLQLQLQQQTLLMHQLNSNPVWVYRDYCRLYAQRRHASKIHVLDYALLNVSPGRMTGFALLCSSTLSPYVAAHVSGRDLAALVLQRKPTTAVIVWTCITTLAETCASVLAQERLEAAELQALSNEQAHQAQLTHLTTEHQAQQQQLGDQLKEARCNQQRMSHVSLDITL